MDHKDFETLIADAVNSLPQSIRDKIRNVAFLVDENTMGNLLGLYHGVPNTHKPLYHPFLPDTITIYRKTIEQEARSAGEQLEKVVKRVVWHEIGHHLGFGEKKIRELEKKWAKEERI
ncbi:MAG: hypothetical protein A3C11_02910 [Candidatus Sungbacteria bacterium RIFCSPHIGHO2_02_FULL_49_12]|uniref:Metallopeptidase family protein n=1 Tax=Candidatus Sungbacteria bacterium RIFCSPHIGHO2_02_FULL_49_12 TaxID=1802271 RepID=A0A1G2KMC4_9BACT|nr:MAG: hypothetical protein A3C11_02910 [Candidatus Sungbacteria bacterium RIFCSPHIGHO2_02_FULL_49_12]